MKELLEDIVKAIDDADSVKAHFRYESTTIYELHVAKDDVGAVIEKGRNITALRVLFAAGTSKTGDKRALLEVVD